MPAPEPAPTLKTAELVVPDLIERPVLGGGCCALLASEVICDAIGAIPGVSDVSCDEHRGLVAIAFDATSAALASAVTVLAELGYPARSAEA